VLGEPADVVAADHQDAPGCDTVRQEAEHGVEESVSLDLLRSRRPQLFELIAHEQHRLGRGLLSGKPREASTALPPGVSTICVHPRLPDSAPADSAGSSPARTTDDLPAPLDPVTTSNGLSTRDATSLATSPSRPWKT